MANKAQKTLAARNAQALNRTLLITLAVHGFYIIWRALLFRSSFTRRAILLYIFLSLPSWLIQFWFERIGRPTLGENGELRRSGEDLEAKGLTEWMWDVLYWTYGCVALAALLGDWAWWLWIVVPVYSAYLAYTTFTGARQGLAGMSGANGAEGAESQGGQGGSKRQQKMEKRGGQRVQYR